MGVRGLRSLLENVMLDLMYDIPSDPEPRDIVVDEDMLIHPEAPRIRVQKRRRA